MTSTATQDDLYAQAVAGYAPALERLARCFETDATRRDDLLQEIHLELWRSLGRFAGECSLRTWLYRVAHNVAATHVLRSKRHGAQRLVSLDEVAEMPAGGDAEAEADRQKTLERLYALIQTLKPVDREVILLYLEGVDAAAIGEVTGLSPGNAATKVHRIKKILAERFDARRTQ